MQKSGRRVGRQPAGTEARGPLLANHPDDVAEFLKDAVGLDKALGQGVLYTRILNRIGISESDPLRKLAYPGLVLRVVTPTLVHDVLAPWYWATNYRRTNRRRCSTASGSTPG
ncbi:hypothetical protein QZH47_05500 [Pseudomonas corrugata]